MKFNAFYFIVFVVGLLLWFMTKEFKRDAKQFFGLAENTSINVNFAHEVKIDEVHVTQGEVVKKGDLLVEATIISTNEDIMVHDFDISKLKADERIYVQGIENQIKGLELDRDLEVQGIDAQILMLKKEIADYDKRFSELEEFGITKNEFQPKKDEIKTLENRRALTIETYEGRIEGIRKSQNLSDNPYRSEIDKLRAQKRFQEAKKNEKISVYSEIDGVVDSVGCQIGENKDGYEVIVKISDFHPSYITGYIPEGFTTKPKLGEKFVIKPIIGINPETFDGKVISAGNKVVPIPQRLSTNPDITSWGTKITISIPESNNFQQAEKVIIEYTPSTNGANNGNGHVTQLENK